MPSLSLNVLPGHLFSPRLRSCHLLLCCLFSLIIVFVLGLPSCRLYHSMFFPGTSSLPACVPFFLLHFSTFSFLCVYSCSFFFSFFLARNLVSCLACRLVCSALVFIAFGVRHCMGNSPCCVCNVAMMCLFCSS